jgi:hypothetical protein
MGRKNTLRVYVTPTTTVPLQSPTLATPPAVSLSTAFNTVYTNMDRLDNVSYQINITTTNSTGIFTLQASSDPLFVNWSTVGTAATVNGTNDTAIVWVNQEYCSAYVRLVYTPTIPGTGTCVIILTAKDIGA